MLQRPESPNGASRPLITASSSWACPCTFSHDDWELSATYGNLTVEREHPAFLTI